MTVNTHEHIAELATAARAAAGPWGEFTPVRRADALDAIADALDDAAAELVALAASETHLPEPRLRGELTRTSFQLRLFGDVLREGSYLGATIDHTDPQWPMGAARPDLRRLNIPLGPVAVFSASNFPFAFSVAGGDTASALAAGCPVIIKAHPGHERLSERVGELVEQALADSGAPAGTFALVIGMQAGIDLVDAPEIAAGAFTGSLNAGRALFDRASRRPVPIPFYAEMGSINPTFVSARAAAERGAEIAEGYAAAITGSAGQLCTKPGVLFAPSACAMTDLIAQALTPPPIPMLNAQIADGYRVGLEGLAATPGVETLARHRDNGIDSAILRVSLREVVAKPDRYLHEVFGPASLVVEYGDESEILDALPLLAGQLTASVFAEPGDDIGGRILAQLTNVAGRVLWNQWPTGLSVTWAQTHGGPYPATTAASSTSVGTAAIERFLRPVTYQNVPGRFLPAALQDENPLGIPRRIDGVLHLPR